MHRLFLVGILSWTLAALAGCERRPGGKGATPETAVPVSKPVLREVTAYVDYTGRINAKNSVVIQPRVTGYLVTDSKEGMPAFKEGDVVKENQILFKIDPRPYQALLEAAEAAVEQNKAAKKYAEVTNLRYQEIAKKQPDAVSPRELDQYQAQFEQATASLKLAESNRKTAKLNLDWTTVRSPLNGQISRYYLTTGNLVNQDVTQLTTVVSQDPMYVYFDMDEPTLLRIKKAIDESAPPPSAGTETTGSTSNNAPFLIALTGEEFNPRDKSRQGVINFIDNQVNPGTGTISVRGELRNPKTDAGTYLLAPGMFVRVRLQIGQPQTELLVIDRAVTSEQGLKYVYVLDDKNTVVARRVTVGALQEDGLRVIAGGVTKEDRVLIGGLQQVRPGMTVPFELHSMPSYQEAATPATAEPTTKKKPGKKK